MLPVRSDKIVTMIKKNTYKIKITVNNKYNEFDWEESVEKNSKIIAENAAIKILEKEFIHAETTIKTEFGEVWYCKENI